MPVRVNLFEKPPTFANNVEKALYQQAVLNKMQAFFKKFGEIYLSKTGEDHSKLKALAEKILNSAGKGYQDRSNEIFSYLTGKTEPSDMEGYPPHIHQALCTLTQEEKTFLTRHGLYADEDAELEDWLKQQQQLSDGPNSQAAGPQ